MEIYNCQLWENAKVLAQDKGLQMSSTCPMVNVCTGEHCVFLKPQQTDKQKLDELRAELSEIENASYEGKKVIEIGA